MDFFICNKSWLHNLDASWARFYISVAFNLIHFNFLWWLLHLHAKFQLIPWSAWFTLHDNKMMSPLYVSKDQLHVLWSNLQSVQKDEEEKTFECSYLGNGWSNFLQYWHVGSHIWLALLQKNGFQSDKRSWSYIGAKIALCFFLSIYSQCGMPASWAAQPCVLIW